MYKLSFFEPHDKQAFEEAVDVSLFGIFLEEKLMDGKNEPELLSEYCQKNMKKQK